jgi:OOP family OmpA-OmpF porin
VGFDADGATLDAQGMAQLDAFARKLSKFPDRSVHVVGYTDSAAADSPEEWLSEQRAKRVAAYLVSRGIPADRVSLEGRGGAAPMGIGTAPNNRVAEVTVR